MSVSASSASGTATYSFITAPYDASNEVLNSTMNASRSGFSRMDPVRENGEHVTVDRGVGQGLPFPLHLGVGGQESVVRWCQLMVNRLGYVLCYRGCRK